ncbi:T-cell surface antigen CD2-like [Pimephales promelas]|nr:T-cell surface antigen CD2-like [Pimephales promelas]
MMSSIRKGVEWLKDNHPLMKIKYLPPRIDSMEEESPFSTTFTFLSLPLEVEYQDKNTYSCVLNNPISNQTTHLDINTLCRHTCADRLKLDDQTGSLTITHTTTEHTGVYQLQINGAKTTSKTFNVSVYARLPVPVIISNSSHCPSSSSPCSVVCSSSVLSVCDATLSWYAGMSVLSSISVCDLSISLSLPLEVEYQDKNTYSCVLNNPISNQTTHLDINTLCRHTCAVSVSLIVLISAGSLMIAAVGIFWICKKRKERKTDEEGKRSKRGGLCVLYTSRNEKSIKTELCDQQHPSSLSLAELLTAVEGLFPFQELFDFSSTRYLLYKR